MRRAGPSGDRDEAGERSSNSEKAVEERAAAAAGVAIDGGKGDPAECGLSPVSARAPADGGAVTDDSMGFGAEGDRGKVGARAPTEGVADANGGATVVGS